MKKLFFTLFAVSVLCSAQTLVNVYNFPYYSPYNYLWGVTHADNYLWLGSDYYASSAAPYARIYKVSRLGEITDSILSPFKFNHGLSWDGSNFWIAEDYRSGGARVFKISPTGVRLDSIALPNLIGGASGGIGGIEIYNGFIWFTVYYPDFTSYPYSYAYKMDLSTRQVTDTIPLRGRQVQGITVKGDTVFYVTDNFQGDAERIYAYRKTVNDTIFSFPLPDPDGDNNPKGLHWDGSNLWLVADRVGSASYAYKALYKYSLGGSGTPVIQTTASIAFGDITIGLPQARQLYVSNTGTGDLRIDSIKINNTLFSVSPLDLPHIVPPGQGKNYTVTFAPVNAANENGTLTIFSNDVSAPQKPVALSGHGVYSLPYISLSHDALGFGGKRKHSTSSLTLTIANLGGGRLRIDSVALGTSEFYLYRQSFPVYIDSTASRNLKIWFRPGSLQTYTDILKIYSNASNGNIKQLPASGSGIAFDSTLGSILWQGIVPDNPSISLQDLSAKNMKKISDLNGDGVADILVATDNYQVIAYNGNSSGSADVIWSYIIGTNGQHAGNVERLQCLQPAADFNNDGVRDIIIGTSGGSESVIALSGLDGTRLWQFGDTVNYDQGDIYGLDVKRDWTGDGVPDVLAAASGNEYSGSGRFSVYCLNGINGSVVWQINEAAQYKLKYGVASTDDGGAYGSRIAGSTPGVVTGFNKSGQIIWNFTTPAAPWAVEEIPDMGGNPGSDILVGDTYGHVYCIDGKDGQQIWSRTLGNVFVEDLVVTDDINNSGRKDILVSSLAAPLYMLEGGTGEIIWQANTGATILGAGAIGDLTGDGVPEMAAGNLANYLRLYNGVTGTEIFSWVNGSSSDNAVESVWGIGDVDGNGTPEFIAGTREGRVVAFCGGYSGSSSPKLTVISPNGGELLLVNNQFQIRWNSINVDNVKIEYTTDNGLSWLLIAAVIPAVQSAYSWPVPNTPTTAARIRISNFANPAVFDISDNLFTIAAGSSVININMKSGWNLVSVPFISPNMQLGSLFPLANSQAFYYSNGYIGTDTLQIDKGYWVRYGQNAVAAITGSAAGYNTIHITAGWNMIGIHNLPVPVDGISTIPAGILTSSFFGYDNGYYIAQQLNAGSGYWIRSSQPGVINLSSNMKSNRKTGDAESSEKNRSIVISDMAGHTTRLLILTGEKLQPENYMLPPAGPSGSFDVRFASGRYAELAGSGAEITISGAEYPVTIYADECEINLTDKITGGRMFSAQLKKGGTVRLDNPAVTSILIVGVDKPQKYIMFNNYPNPFNISTRIRYELPEAGLVTIKLFSLLGKTTYIANNYPREAGIYTIDINAADLASGIYILELQCNKFTARQKIMLVK